MPQEIQLVDVESRQVFVEYLVQKRVKSLDYLRRVFTKSKASRILWMNVIDISEDIHPYYHPVEQEDVATPESEADEGAKFAASNSIQWLYLGISLAAVLPLPGGDQFINTISALLLEYEHFFSSGASRILRSRALKKARTSSGSPTTAGYLYFVHPPLSFAPSLPICVTSLCSTLVLVYRRLFDCEAFEDDALVKKILKIDATLKTHFLTPLTKSLTSLAMRSLNAQMNFLNTSVFASFQNAEQDLSDELAKLAATVAPSPDRNRHDPGAPREGSEDESEFVIVSNSPQIQSKV